MDDLFSNVLIEPRPYQQRIIRKICELFTGKYIDPDNNCRRKCTSIMLESATGSGKTAMAWMVARYLQRTAGFLVCWSAIRRNLLSQARQENESRGFDVDGSYLSMFERNIPRHLAIRNSKLLFIVDEGHHDATNSMARIHEALKPELVLGMTATGFRTDKLKLCFQEVVRDVGIQQLIDDGYLSRYSHYTIREYEPTQVANTYAREPNRWGKSLIFFHRLNHCLECQAVLKQHGIPSELVSATSSREQQLLDFENGRVNVLISMSILAEGFDSPSLKTTFVRPSRKFCTMQMAGRLFRLHPNIPVKQLVQCEQTRHVFTRTAKPLQQFVWQDGGWKALQINEQISDVSRRCLLAIAHSRAQALPRFISTKSNPAPHWDNE